MPTNKHFDEEYDADGKLVRRNERTEVTPDPVRPTIRNAISSAGNISGLKVALNMILDNVKLVDE